MKRVMMICLSFALMLSFGMAVFAAETETVGIDVYARYVGVIKEENTVPVQNGAADITTDDGTKINVTGAPDAADVLVAEPIPATEKEAWDWITDCLEDKGKPVLAYDIYFLDKKGHHLSGDGATVTIANPFPDKKIIVCSVNTDGTSQVLTTVDGDAWIDFDINRSYYYILVEVPGSEEPDTEEPGSEEPDTEEPASEEPDTEEPASEEPGTEKPGSEKPSETTPSSAKDETGKTPVQSPETGDGSNILLWMITAFISGLVIVRGAYERKKCAGR